MVSARIRTARGSTMTNIIATISVLAILLLSLACGTKSASDSVPTTTESTPVENVPARNVSTENASPEDTPIERDPSESPTERASPPGRVSTENGQIGQYARLTCAADSADDIPNDATWGDYVELLEEAIDLQENITPPAELRDYHNAGVAAAKSVLDLAKDKPKDDPLNQFEILGAPEVMVLAMAVGSISDEFPDDVREEFVKAGCSGFEEEPETQEDAESGTLWYDREMTAEYTRHQDPLTDEVTLFFGIASTEDHGNLVIRADCSGVAQVLIDVNVYSFGEGDQSLLVRFDEGQLQEETWTWERLNNAPEWGIETMLSPGTVRTAELFANVMASEKLAVRYPESDSISEMTFVFDTTKLQDLWDQEGLKGCE